MQLRDPGCKQFTTIDIVNIHLKMTAPVTQCKTMSFPADQEKLSSPPLPVKRVSTIRLHEPVNFYPISVSIDHNKITIASLISTGISYGVTI